MAIDIYEPGGLYGDRPPDIEEEIYGPLEEMSLLDAQAQFPGAFDISPEAMAAIERGEKTPLQLKEEKAVELGMTLDQYLSEENKAEHRAAFNRKALLEAEEKGLTDFTLPETEKWGYGMLDAKDILKKKFAQYGDKPPTDWQAPDYSPQGRTKFEQIVFNRLGGNPFIRNWEGDLDREVNAQLPNVFASVFGNQIRWQDRDKMSRKQQAHWQNQVNKLRAHIGADLDAQKRQAEWMYKSMMGEFDARAKRFEKAQEDIDKAQNAMVRMHNPRTGIEIRAPRKEVEARMAEGFIEGVPYGPSKRTPTVSDYDKLYKHEEDMFDEENLVDGKVDPERLRIANHMREALDLEPWLEEEITEKKVQNWWQEKIPDAVPFIGGSDDETETRYEYSIREGAQDEQDTRKRITEEPETTPGEADADPDAPDSNVITDLEGNPIPAVDAQGNPLPAGKRANSAAGPIVVAGGYWYKVE